MDESIDDTGERNLVLWDGDCGFCAACIAWVMRHDKDGKFLAIPWQQCRDIRLTPAIRANCREALHVITKSGFVLSAGRAVLFILYEISGSGLFKLATLRPFSWFVEVGYRLVAGNRQVIGRCAVALRLIPKGTVCAIPDQGVNHHE
jgi:predicted DCC family thiol-disulfide oxidoreductase YuxK